MCLFIESICVKAGRIRNIALHQKRFEQTQQAFFDKQSSINLKQLIKRQNPPNSGTYKYRIVYAENIKEIKFIPYQIKTFQTFRVCVEDEVEYAYKSLDREIFKRLKSAVQTDEIIMVKNGKVTDTSFSNLVFFDGKDWVTPKSYLLNGVMRQSLLLQAKIKEKEIEFSDIKKFTSFKLINAMMNLEESPNYMISAIQF